MAHGDPFYCYAHKSFYSACDHLHRSVPSTLLGPTPDPVLAAALREGSRDLLPLIDNPQIGDANRVTVTVGELRALRSLVIDRAVEACREMKPPNTDGWLFDGHAAGWYRQGFENAVAAVIAKLESVR